MKIVKNKDSKSFNIDVKRFYIPYRIELHCPECGTAKTVHLDDSYLSYPVVGEPFDYYFYCEECEHEFSKKFKLNINLTCV